MKHKRAIFLTEMGLGPQWLLRETSAVAAAPTLSGQAQGQAQPRSLGWTSLQTTIQACRACARGSERRQAMLGSGDVQAAWLFVASAPDAAQDESGEAIAGAAGRLFTNMLAALDLRHGENVFFTHAAKCFGQSAEDRALQACRAHLHDELNMLNPALIIALGASTGASLVGAPTQRGQVYTVQGRRILQTHALDELLRNPQSKADAWADLCLALDYLRPTHAAAV